MSKSVKMARKPSRKKGENMKKFSIAAVLAASLVSSAVAIDLDGVFVGAEGKYNFKSELETSLNLPTLGFSRSFNADESSFGLGLKVGYDFDFMRVYGAYNHNFEAKATDIGLVAALVGMAIPEELKYSGNDFILGADWTPKFSLAGLDFKGILGAFAGISKIDVDYSIADSLGSVKLDYSQDGFIYGLKLGAIYEAAKQHEIEFGFKFDSAKYDDKDTTMVECSGTCVYEPAKISDAKRTNMGVFVGYNYKF